MKYFKLVHAPTWKFPQYMNFFSIHMYKTDKVRYLQLFLLSATP